MIDMLLALLRVAVTGAGLLAPDVAQSGSWAVVAVALAVLAAAVLVPSLSGGSAHTGDPHRAHPARTDVRDAVVAQSDPAAPGHILRRGPSPAVPAA